MSHTYLCEKQIYNTPTSAPYIYYGAPLLDQVESSIALDNFTQSSVIDAANPGLMLCSYAAPKVISNSVYLGDDPLAVTSLATRNALADMMDLSRAAMPGDNLEDLLADTLLTAMADPSGIVRWKPVRTSVARGLRFKLGDYTYAQRFSSAHPSFQATLDVRWADYRKQRPAIQALLESKEPRDQANGARMLAALKRSTDDAAKRLFGIELESDSHPSLDQLIPTEYRGDGYLKRATTRDETWTTADSDNINGDLNWNEDQGDIDVVSNEIRTITLNTNLWARCTDALSSDDHWSSLIGYSSNINGNRDYGPTARKIDSAVRTYYVLDANHDGGNLRLQKKVAGTSTQIGSSVSHSWSANVDYDLKLEANGSLLNCWVDSVQKFTDETDTSITGNLLFGVEINKGSNGHIGIKEAHAADLAAGLTAAEIMAALQATNQPVQTPTQVIAY